MKSPILETGRWNFVSTMSTRARHDIQGYHHNGDQAARRPHILAHLRSLVWGIVNAITSLAADVLSNMLSFDIFVDLQPFDCNLKGEFSNPGLQRQIGGDRSIR